MGRRKEGALDIVASLPWPVGLAVGCVAFAAIRYGVPWWFASTDNVILQGFAKALAGLTPLAVVVMAGCWIAAGVSFLRARQRRHLLDAQSGLDTVRALNWREFELLVGEAFRRQGYEVEEVGGGGPDGGVDLMLRKGGATELVQCKQWRSRQVKVSTVREMWGLAAHHQADGIKIVCTGNYTRDAEAFARNKPIQLISGEALVALVRSVQSEPIAKQPSPSAAPIGSTPECPKCGGTMVRRENRSTGQAFWGCQGFPKCMGTRQTTPT